MFQTFHGQTHYVVDLTEFPPPMPIHAGGDLALVPYADALTQAIESGIVKEAGKYAIHVDPINKTWTVSKIIE